MNIKVDVPKRGCCSQWVSWHHNASEAACRTLWGAAVRGIKWHYSIFFLQTQALEAADFADVRPLFAPLMHAVGKEIFVTAWPCFFADVLGLQQLRVLQHNRQDHRSDAGFFHLFSFFLWAVDIIGDVQPPDRHGSKVPRPKLNFPNWGESVMWTQIQITCQFRLKRGLRKWKCQFATWRSSKPVSWWEKGLESKFSSTNTSGVQDGSAVVLHRPGQAGPILGVPRAARLQAFRFLRRPTPHHAWVLLHCSPGEKVFYVSTKIISPSFPKFMKLEKVEIGGIRGKALTSNIGKVYEEFKVKLVFWHPCSIDIATWSGSLLQSFLLNCLNFVALTQQHGLVSGSLQCIQSPILRQSWSKRSRLPERLREVQRPGFLPGQVPPNNRKSQMAKSNQRTPTKS